MSILIECRIEALNDKVLDTNFVRSNFFMFYLISYQLFTSAQENKKTIKDDITDARVCILIPL